MKQHRPRQAAEKLAAGDASKDHGPVFASAVVPPLDAANVRREFRAIASAAGIDEAWAPREKRHTFVPLLSASGR